MYMNVEVNLMLCRELAVEQVKEWFPLSYVHKPREKKQATSKPAVDKPARRRRTTKEPDSEDDGFVRSEG